MRRIVQNLQKYPLSARGIHQRDMLYLMITVEMTPQDRQDAEHALLCMKHLDEYDEFENPRQDISRHRTALAALELNLQRSPKPCIRSLWNKVVRVFMSCPAEGLRKRSIDL